jgi:N utilization substance protein B
LPAVVTFARQLVLGTVEHVEQIDELIRRHAEIGVWIGMAIVDRNILRVSVQEFCTTRDSQDRRN